MIGSDEKMASLLILTAGGHGQVVGETAACVGYEKIGFLDDGKELGAAVGGGGCNGNGCLSDVSAPIGKVVGGTGDVDRFLASGEYDAVFPALGNNLARQKWMKEHEELVWGRDWVRDGVRSDARGKVHEDVHEDVHGDAHGNAHKNVHGDVNGVVPTLVHPTAWVSPSAKLGPGVLVEAMAVVNANVVVGAGTIIGIGVKVDHDAVIGECAHIDAGAIVHARGKVNDLAKVEAGAVVGE